MIVGFIIMLMGLSIFMLAPTNPVAVFIAVIAMLTGLYDLMKGMLKK